MEEEDRSSRSKSHDDDDDDQKNSRKRKDTDTKLMSAISFIEAYHQEAHHDHHQKFLIL